jgi:hypothetical protein
MSKQNRTIKLSYDPKPIPVRQFDWCAYDDDHVEDGRYGYGKTAAEALRDLADLIEDEDNE